MDQSCIETLITAMIIKANEKRYDNKSKKGNFQYRVLIRITYSFLRVKKVLSSYQLQKTTWQEKKKLKKRSLRTRYQIIRKRNYNLLAHKSSKQASMN